MHINKTNILQRTISFSLTYLILAILASFVLWAIVNGVITKLDSIPEITRRGYENPYLSVLVMLLIFLFVTIVIYVLAITFIPKTSRSSTTNVIIGVIAGLLPIILGYLCTYGFPYSSIPDLINILILSIAGGFIPIIERRVIGYIEKI